ncbi:MAG: bacterio-opsin activator domain-containing protein [Halolamina sp.]
MSEREIPFGGEETGPGAVPEIGTSRATPALNGLTALADSNGAVAHIAAVYEDERERLETVVPFLREGLREDERCAYVVGDAINAVEADQPLDDDHVVDLEFTVTDEGSAGVEMARELGCDISIRGVVTDPDDQTWAFVELDGATGEELLEYAPKLPGEDVEVVCKNEDSNLYKIRPREGSVTGTVKQHGGQLRAVSVDGDEAVVSIRMPGNGSADAFVEAFEREQPSDELRERRERPLSDPTVHGYTDALTEALTTRQEEVLRTAHYSGYFEEPRATTSVEVADQLDISQPTFSSHLRSATRKLCRAAFEQETADD